MPDGHNGCDETCRMFSGGVGRLEISKKELLIKVAIQKYHNGIINKKFENGRL